MAAKMVAWSVDQTVEQSDNSMVGWKVIVKVDQKVRIPVAALVAMSAAAKAGMSAVR